ncbi:MAG: hypothetical protein RLZZ316_2076 [Bacteroidota bacterium]|jgi:predicted nucleic acid-binding protein
MYAKEVENGYSVKVCDATGVATYNEAGLKKLHFHDMQLFGTITIGVF